MELYSPEYSLKPIRTGENKPQMFVQKISIKFWVATDVWILAARSGAGVTQPGSPAPAAEFGACDRPEATGRFQTKSRLLREQIWNHGPALAQRLHKGKENRVGAETQPVKLRCWASPPPRRGSVPGKEPPGAAVPAGRRGRGRAAGGAAEPGRLRLAGKAWQRKERGPWEICAFIQ